MFHKLLNKHNLINCLSNFRLEIWRQKDFTNGSCFQMQFLEIRQVERIFSYYQKKQQQSDTDKNLCVVWNIRKRTSGDKNQER